MNVSKNRSITLATLLLATAGALAQPCTNNWTPLGSGVSGQGANTMVTSLISFDNGSGPALYAWGSFTTAGGVTAGGFARWDGTRWSSPTNGGGGGGTTSPSAMAIFDDGSGAALYLAAQGVFRLTGSSFSLVGPPATPPATTIIVFDDGTGPALYAGGTGGGTFNGIGKWNGISWSTVGGGVSNGSVYVFGIYDDDGPGPHAPALYVGGSFDHAGGVPANGIAKWDGTSWSALGSGLLGISPSFPEHPASMAVYDDGTGPQLYVSGYFYTAGGLSAHGVARWNGTTWSSNFGTTFNFDSAYAMQVFDDGRGPALWLAGSGSGGGAFGANYGIARWDGISWTNPNTTPVGGVGGQALAIYDSGSGPGLYFGGAFSTLNGVSANNIARWGRPMCPANCDGSFNAAGCPTLNAADFGCYINRFATGDLRGNCDGSTVNPILTCNDFMCFMNKFAAGCS